MINWEEALRHAAIPVVSLDKEGVITFCNENVLKQCGSPDTMCGKKMIDFATKATKKRLASQVALMQREKKNITIDCTFKNTGTRGVRIKFSFSVSADGETFLGVGTGKNPKEKPGLDTDFLSSINAPVFGILKNGTINIWNAKAAKVTKYPKNQVRGKKFVENYVSEAFKEAVEEKIEQVLAGAQTDRFVIPLITKNGYRVDISLNAIARYDANGAIIGLIGIGQVCFCFDRSSL